MLSAILINGPTVVAESGSGSYSASAVWSDGAFTAITPAWSSSNPAIFGGPGNPVAGVTENVVSVWRWNALLQRWGFYSPLLTAEQNAAYAVSQGYELLISIQPGEGFWVNISGQVTLLLQAGSPAGFAFSDFDALPPGFNLITISQEMTPTEFNNSVAQAAPPAEGAAMTANFTSLWVWDATRQKWYFYSPILEASGGLPAVSSYAAGQGFLHFQDYGKTLGAGTGFWVHK